MVIKDIKNTLKFLYYVNINTFIVPTWTMVEQLSVLSYPENYIDFRKLKM